MNRGQKRAIRALMAEQDLPYMEAARRLGYLDGPRERAPEPPREHAAGGTVTPRPVDPDVVPVFLSPGREITDPEEAEALGLTGSSIRRRLSESGE